jgi:hypothetical protein
MPNYLILAQSETTADALDAWLQLLGEVSVAEGNPRRIVWKQKSSGGEAAIWAYESLVRRIEAAANGEDGTLPLNEVVVLVDTIRPDSLSAIYEGCSWDNLLAMLILSFPEIQWVFGFVRNDRKLPDKHKLASLWTTCHRDPLLDPTGLRECVRSQTNQALGRSGDDLKLAHREKQAAAIDEERDYAYLNGYTAYRFGCRADVVTTWTLMQQLFSSKGGGEKEQPHDYWLLLEDMSLNFADKPGHIHLLRLDKYEKNKQLQGRAFWCLKLDSPSSLENSAYRILVTTGQARDDSILKTNVKYLNRKKNGKGKPVFKPAKGMLGLWKDADLPVAPGFAWPPSPTQIKTENGGHGSPGKLMLVAGTLIRRSRGLLDRTSSVGAAIRGAVLAIDALELTGGRTPTFAVDALTLKHHFEVMAECRFAGVAHQIETTLRWKDIEAETENISRWFQKKEMKKAKLNARMYVLNDLLRVFRENNKFAEEQYCMIRVRRLHNNLWMTQRWGRFVFLPFLRYFELLMTSVLWFVTCVSIWVLIFGWLFKQSGHYPTYWHGLSDAISSIFSISAPFTHHLSPNAPPIPGFYAVLVCGAILVGVTHLGVFVSHLYTIVSRK